MGKRVKEYALHGIYEGLDRPEKYAVERASPPVGGNPPCHCGAGVAANLVALGLAEWAGPNTWITEWSPLGRRLCEVVHGG